MQSMVSFMRNKYNNLPIGPNSLLLEAFLPQLVSVQLSAPTRQPQKHKHQFYQILYHVGNTREPNTYITNMISPKMKGKFILLSISWREKNNLFASLRSCS